MAGWGAYLNGGRWNTSERFAVYLSGTVTLAMLEVLVHIDDAEAFLSKQHVYHSVSFDDSSVAVLEQDALPPAWNARPETLASQVVGDEFLERGEHAVLAVPSVVVPTELRYDPLYMNYLLNPRHPELATTVEVGEVHYLDWDPRLSRG
jgi:RES domain-containing protein